MRVPVYEMDHGACPYLEDRTWITHSFSSRIVDSDLYESLLGRGWRRSGGLFYQNHCPGCSKCIPIRVPADRFTPSKSQRRVARHNRDVTVEAEPIAFDPDTYELYAAYVAARHDAGRVPPEHEYRSFLCESPIETLLMKYRTGGRLVGAGWVDVLPDGLSSAYFAFDPAESSRSLGTYSVMCELDHVLAMGKAWLYLGFYVPGSRKMAYKSQFRPHELLMNDQWVDFSDDGVRESPATPF